MKKILYLNQISEIAGYVDRAVIDYINEGQIETFESFDNFNIIAFDWYDIYNVDADPAQVMIYFDRDDIFFICENEAAYNTVSRTVRDAPTNERALYTFFITLLRGDGKYLEALEDRVTESEETIITERESVDATEKIVEYRSEILRLKRYYDQLDSIFEELVENDNDLISGDSIKYFAILGSRTDRLLRSLQYLRDYVTQLREAYQAQIDIEQNKLMKVFTVITSVFLPLSLLVGWYGMNLKMPEYEWQYSYPSVIIISIIVIIGMVILFKRKRWF